MADDYSGTQYPLVAPPTFMVGGETFVCTPGDTTLVYLLSYFQTIANLKAAAAWPAGGEVVSTIRPYDPDDAGMSEAWLPAMFLWAKEIGKSYRRAEDYLVRPVTLKMLWIPKTPPGQDKQRTRGPFGSGLHAVLSIAVDQLRDPSWVVGGDPDAKAAAQGSMISNFAKFYWLRFMSWKPVVYNHQMGDGPAQPFRGFEGELEMLELWDRDLGSFDLLSGGLVTRFTTNGLQLGRTLNP